MFCERTQETKTEIVESVRSEPEEVRHDEDENIDCFGGRRDPWTRGSRCPTTSRSQILGWWLGWRSCCRRRDRRACCRRHHRVGCGRPVLLRRLWSRLLRRVCSRLLRWLRSRLCLCRRSVLRRRLLRDPSANLGRLELAHKACASL